MRARYGPVHLVVGRACVHVSGSMDGLCYMKYAKPTGHVPQLFYDAWHDSKGRFESRFLRLIAILPVVEPGGPTTGPKWGWTSTVVIYGHDWVGQSTRDLYQKPQRSPRRSYRGRVGSEKTGRTTDVKTTEYLVETITFPGWYMEHDTWAACGASFGPNGGR